MSEGFVDAAGVRIFVRDSGEGAPVLLLHGFPETGECWRFVAPGLALRHRVIVPDLPGFGQSEAPPAFDAKSVAGILAALIEEIGTGPMTVVGHDWGGSLSHMLALEHPKLVERLVVVNAPFRQIDFKRALHMVLLNLPVLPEIGFKTIRAPLIRLMLTAGSANRSWIDGETIARYADAYAPLERTRSALAYYRTITRSAALKGLRRLRPGVASRPAGQKRTIGSPTMIVWGMKDPVLPPSLLGGISRDIPGARIEPIDGCGHFVPEENPRALLDRILSFIGE